MKPPFILSLFIGAISLAAHPASVSFENVKDKIVIVQCDDSSGSGFVCEMDGKRYFLTNKHVVSAQQRVAAFFCNGQQLKFGRMEIAENADLVRFAVSSNQPAFKIAADEPKMNERISVFGNSDAKGVLTENTGRIVGIGPGELEVTANFVHGNSGSPLVNANGEVLGVATYAVKDFDPDDWVKAETRYAKVRRFALRMNGYVWKKSDIKGFYRKTMAKRKKTMVEMGVYPETKATFKSPVLRINKRQTVAEATYFVNGNIVLGLSDVKGIKNPVIRVVVMVEGGRHVVMDAIADSPGGEYKFSNVPVYSYAMPRSNFAFNVGNNIAAYFLEGISFHQPVARLDSVPGGGKNIEYFNRSILLSGGFRLPDCVGGGVRKPNIVAFRLECWQNGSLAGVYNSVRPDTLNSKGIPVDWFVMGRYPKKFLYAENCPYTR
jgi:hypothetical protein